MRILWVGDTTAAETNHCYINDAAEDLADAELFLMSRHYEAVVLVDLALTWSSLRWIGRFKEQHPHTVLALVCRGKGDGEAAFLKAGGDLYIPHPQSGDGELVRLRIERFALRHLSDERVRIGAFELDPFSGGLSFGGERIEMERDTFRTLQHLVLKRQRFMDKAQIVSALYEQPEYVESGTVDRAINAIRQQLDRRFGVLFIKTIRNKGYGFVYNS